MDRGPRASLEGRYRLRSIIGEGGMGTVWSAERLADGGDVAVKILKVQDVEQMRRLVREARIAQRLQHEHVVRVDDVLASAAETPALVMERLRGESLRERLSRSSRLPLGEAARILLDMSSALEAAHALGIIHRDLKPENVYLHHDGARTVVKVLDFGVAKIVGASELHTAGMTRTGTMLGTPYYMPPEQVFGEGDVDARADVWACGVVLFECLAGQRPFEGDNPGQVFKAIAMGAPPSLLEHLTDPPEVAEAVSNLVVRMLAQDRSARPSLAEVRACLSPFAEAQLAQAVISTSDPADALAPTLAAAAVGRDAVPTPGSFEMRTEAPGRFTARRGLGALAAAAGVAVTVVLFVLVRRPSEGPGESAGTADVHASVAADGALPGAVEGPLAAGDAALEEPLMVAAPPAPPAPRAAMASPRARASASASPSAARLPGGVRLENPY